MSHFKGDLLIVRPLYVVAFCGLLLFSFSPALFAQKNYLLGPEDVIEIIVWGHDDLRRLIPVSLDGTITFPMIGEVKAVGKSTQGPREGDG